MLKELLKPEIQDLIDGHLWNDLKAVLESWPAPEIAELLLDIPKSNRVLLFRSLPRELSSEVFSHFEPDQQNAFLYEMTDQETRELLSDMSPDDRTELLEELPSEVTRTIMNLLSAEDFREALQLLGYPEDSIGRQMTPDFVAIRPNWTVKDALAHIRKYGKHSETVNRVYVTDSSGRLIDDILLRNIILASEDDKIDTLMDFNVVSISAFDDQEEAVHLLEKYDIAAIPVVDSKGHLIGIVTFDDIFDIQEEEATEDFQKIGAINPVDQSYLSASIWRLWGKRFPWLLVLLLMNFLTAGVINKYEDVLSSATVLAAFIPLLIGTAGNSGTQSATLIIRSLAIGDVEISNWFKVVSKELLVGLMLGSILGLVVYFGGFLGGANETKIAVIISLSMIILVVWANIIGCLLPIILAKIKLDPAVISGPFIATIIDVTGMLVYFNIAMLVLSS